MLPSNSTSVSSGRGRLPGLSRLLFLFAVASLPLAAHDPITTGLTWSKEISRIVYKNCSNCHREGGEAMPLVTYEQARPWAKAIRDEVASRRMPPWGAVPGIGLFSGDRSLSGPEIEMLIAWVEGGAPEGDPAFLPSHLPARSAPLPLPRHTRTLVLAQEQTLPAPVSVVAIKPLGRCDVWATGEGGRVVRLLWVPQPDRLFHGPFIYRTPQNLPGGTTLHIEGRAALYLR